MVIEWLKFKVEPELREKFIQMDESIWTPAVTGHYGFLGKEVWINPDDPAEVVLVIHWESVEKWHTFPAERVQEIEAQFNQSFPGQYQLVEEGTYQVRKFPQA